MKENGIMGQKAAYTVKKAGQPLENGLEKNWIFIKKNFKKCLTNTERCGIIMKSLRDTNKTETVAVVLKVDVGA